MLKKRYILVALGVISVLFGSLLYSNIILAQSGGEYDPWLDYNEDGLVDVRDLQSLSQKYSASGDPSKDVYVTNWPQSLLGEQTTRKLAIYAINTAFTNGPSYAKAGEIVVPTGEKWFIYKITIHCGGDVSYGAVRLVVGGVIMMDDVSMDTLGPSPIEMELRKPLELFEGEKVELWHRTWGGQVSNCLLIEAWVEEM